MLLIKRQKRPIKSLRKVVYSDEITHSWILKTMIRYILSPSTLQGLLSLPIYLPNSLLLSRIQNLFQQFM